MSYLFSVLLVLWCLVFPSLLVHADGHPVINEFLPHPGTGNKEWVELYVPDGIDVSNYWIDDDTDFSSDTGSSSKKQITSVVQGSDNHHVVFELSSSMFNNDGDTIALFAPDGTLVDQYRYTSDPGTDISLGRTPDATGDFQILATATRGSPNSNPQPTDTPTPAPTEKPTSTPKPIPTDKPIKSPTATVSKLVSTTNTSSTIISNPTGKNSLAKSSSFSPTKISTNSAIPTSILGVSTKVEKKAKSASKPPVLVKSASSSLPQTIAVSIGGLLFVGCGILMYLKKKGKLNF